MTGGRRDTQGRFLSRRTMTKVERYNATKRRFLAKVDRSAGPDGCWPWTGALIRGYGSFRLTNGDHIYAHRYMYRWRVGRLDDDLTIDHLCGNPRCVNPRHLEPVTQQENSARYFRGRTHCRNGHAYSDADYIRPDTGSRMCRACIREATDRRREARQARKAAA